jgi:membrane protease YdiL (CAAX protease family)
MNQFKSFVKRFSLPIFFGFAYILSWFPSLSEAHSILPLGPLFAALIVLAFLGWSDVKDFLRRILQWRVDLNWYALVLFLPVAITGGAVALNLVFRAHSPAWERLPPFSELPATFIFILLFIGLGEEPAWRGFALPRLLNGRNALTASLLLGIFHIAWHLPLFGLEFDATNGLPWGLGLIAYTIITTWLYNRTDGNLLLPILFHASVNVTAKYLFNPLFTGTDLIHLWWLWSGLWWVVAIGVLVLNGSQLAKPVSEEYSVFQNVQKGRTI